MTTLQKRAAAGLRAAMPSNARALGQIVRDSFFQYVQNFTFTVGTENFQITIPVQADAHFICVATQYDSSLAVGAGGGTVLASGGSLIQLTDTSAQRFLQSAQVPISALFGTAQRPYVWPFTHLFRANGGIGISITGTAAAGQVQRLVFAGFKIPVGSIPELKL